MQHSKVADSRHNSASTESAPEIGCAEQENEVVE
jgi:hypothetical protein